MEDGIILIKEPLEHSHERLYGPFEVQRYINDTSRILTYSDVGINIDILHSFDGSREHVIRSTIRSPLKMHRSEKFEARTRFFYILINRDVKAIDVNKELYIEIFTLWSPSELLAMRDLYEIKVRNSVREIVDLPRSEPVSLQSSSKKVDYEEGRVQSPKPQRVASPKPRRLSIAEENLTEGFSEYESDADRDLRSEIIRNSKRSSIKKKLFGRNHPKIKQEHDSRLPSYICQHALLVGGVGGSVGVIPRGEQGAVLMFTDVGPQWVKIPDE